MRTMVVAACAVALAACGGGTASDQVAQAVTDSPTAVVDPVDDVYQGLTRAQRVRQLIMPSIDTLDPAAARAVVRNTKPGGLIIMAQGNAKQWRAVVKAAQAQARQLGLPPLLIGADQENGTLVRRLRMPVTLPGAMVLGAAVAGDAERGSQAATNVAKVTGRWLAAAGVNLDFAPVADVNVRPSNPVIGIRSPGAFPGVVGRAVAGQVEGFDQAGILSTAKHFPGHGDTATDSHLGLAKVTHSRAQMARIDLPPFQDAVDAGVPAIMVAHVTVPAYDNRPATVSKKIVTGILRERMGFDGLVVSDSLGMAAVASRPKLAVEVIRAGGDVLLMPNDPNRAVAQVLAAQGSGLSKARVRDAVEHVLAAKQRLGLLEAPPTYPPKPGTKLTRRIARDGAEAGITVLGTCRKLVGNGATVIGSGPVAEGVRQGLRAAGVRSGGIRVVVSSGSPGATDVWVATGSPYAALNGAARQRVLTYGDVAASGWAAGQAIAGRLETLGGLPVKGPKPCARVG
ncbi:MAG: glycoside hydrolase family 3 protein [Candidatus Nanopelagicales bacterium]|nr:glycoside hydrolase family 3 protein [Candidatus Nanopelagicales bacterium]MCU0297194.1 glycoside hydrolase family 3 protein [Candidatus Nanopelagicales bacterium]